MAASAQEHVSQAVGGAASTVGSFTSRQMVAGRHGFADAMEQRPLLLAVAALALGAAIGGLLPRTRREDEMWGESRDQLKQRAIDRGRETLREAEHAAERAIDEATSGSSGGPTLP